MAGAFRQQTLLARLSLDHRGAGKRQGEGAGLDAHGVQLGGDQALPVVIQVQQAEDGNQQHQHIEGQDAPGERRGPATARAPRARLGDRHFS